MAQWFLITLSKGSFNLAASGKQDLWAPLKSVLEDTGARRGSLSDMEADIFPPENEGTDLTLSAGEKAARTFVFGVPTERANQFEERLKAREDIEEIVPLDFTWS